MFDIVLTKIFRLIDCINTALELNIKKWNVIQNCTTSSDLEEIDAFCQCYCHIKESSLTHNLILFLVNMCIT